MASASARRRAIGFSTSTCFARPRRRQGLFPVQAARRAQADGVDVGALEQRLEARLARHAELRRRLAGARGVGAADGREPSARRLRDGSRVVASDHARADDPEADLRAHTPSPTTAWSSR